MTMIYKLLALSTVIVAETFAFQCFCNPNNQYLYSCANQYCDTTLEPWTCHDTRPFMVCATVLDGKYKGDRGCFCAPYPQGYEYVALGNEPSNLAYCSQALCNSATSTKMYGKIGRTRSNNKTENPVILNGKGFIAAISRGVKRT